MICPKCGKEYNDKMTCCISCGADLVAQDITNEQTIEPLIPEAEHTHENTEQGFVRRLEPLDDVSDIPDMPAMPKKEKRMRREMPFLKGAARAAGSFLASAAMFALILSATAFGVVRLVTDDGKISAFADRLDVMSLPAEGETTVQDAIYVMSLGTGLSREDIRTIYEGSTMRDFAAAQLMGYAEFVRNGTVPERITPEKLKAVFSENLPLIDNTMGHALNNSDIQMVYAEIDRAEPFLEMISPQSIQSAMGDRFFVILRLIGSVPAIIVTGALAAAMLIALRAINRNAAKTLKWGGGAILTGGAAVLAATFLFSMQIPYEGSDRLAKTVLKCACDVISPDLYQIGAILSAAGAVLLIWARSLKKNKV